MKTKVKVFENSHSELKLIDVLVSKLFFVVLILFLLLISRAGYLLNYF